MDQLKLNNPTRTETSSSADRSIQCDTKGFPLGCNSSASDSLPFLPPEFPQCDRGLDVHESVSPTQTRCH